MGSYFNQQDKPSPLFFRFTQIGHLTRLFHLGPAYLDPNKLLFTTGIMGVVGL